MIVALDSDELPLLSDLDCKYEGKPVKVNKQGAVEVYEAFVLCYREDCPPREQLFTLELVFDNHREEKVKKQTFML